MSLANREVVFSPSDPTQLIALLDLLRDELGAASARLRAGQSSEGALGVPDVIVALVSSASVASLIKVLPEFIRSRRSSFRIEIVVEDKKIVVEAENVKTLADCLKDLEK